MKDDAEESTSPNNEEASEKEEEPLLRYCPASPPLSFRRTIRYRGYSLLAGTKQRWSWSYTAAYCIPKLRSVCYCLLALFIVLAGFLTLSQSFAKTAEEYEDNTGCKLPRPDPWDPSVLPYLPKQPYRIKCRRLQPELSWLDERDQRLWLNASALAELRQNTSGRLACAYRCFRRSDDELHIDYDPWTPLVQNGTFIATEMVHVRCRLDDRQVYDNAHAQIVPLPPPPSVAEGSERFLRQPNVVLFIVDSMSHLNWRRELPLFYRLLRERYRSFVFDGLVKSAENSFPNSLAFLAGSYMKPNLFHFEDYPLLFKMYQEKGYATLFSQDMEEHPLYNYRPNTTDPIINHYYRIYQVHELSSELFKQSSVPCYGNNIKPINHLQYLQQFWDKYLRNGTNAPLRRQPIFSLTWLSELSHGLNLIAPMDEPFTRLFADNAALLDDETFVFVFGDHGPRYHPIRETAIGRIEEQMPFFSMHVPSRLLKRYPRLRQTIAENTQRLSSWWDVHVTLREILELGFSDRWAELGGEDGEIQPYEYYWRAYGSPHGLSLLRRLPRDRTCASAGIPPAYCVCYNEKAVDIGDPMVRAAADALVQYANARLRAHADGWRCATLQLDKILRAQVFSPEQPMISRKWWQRWWRPSEREIRPHYRVVLVLSPGEAMLEGVLRPNAAVYDRLRLIGSVVRLNDYVEQPDCMPHSQLKKFCHCRKQ